MAGSVADVERGDGTDNVVPCTFCQRDRKRKRGMVGTLKTRCGRKNGAAKVSKKADRPVGEEFFSL